MNDHWQITRTKTALAAMGKIIAAYPNHRLEDFETALGTAVRQAIAAPESLRSTDEEAALIAGTILHSDLCPPWK